MSRTPRSAFTQVEVLVALAVLAVGILSVFAAFSYHLRVTTYAHNLAQAAALNRRLIELVRTQCDFARPLPAEFNDGRPRLLNASPCASESFTAEELARFQRILQVERVSHDAHSYQYGLWRIRVVLQWQEKGAPFCLGSEAYHRP